MNFLICSVALTVLAVSQAVGQADVAWGQPADAHLVAPPGIDVAPAGWGPSVNGLQVSLVMSPTAIQPGQPLIYLQLHVKNTSDRDVRVLNWDQQLTSLVVKDAAGKVMPVTDDERGDGPKDWDFPTIPAGQSRVFQQMQGWSGRVEKEALVFCTPHSM